MENDDIANPTNKFSIGNKIATLKSGSHDLSDVHPDLMALSIILMCNPFVGKKLDFSFPISEQFETAANGILTRYKIKGNGDYIEPRKVNRRFRPGLAFSGGVDSTAALAVMPGNTVPIFMDRPVSKGSLYDPDAAHRSCEILKEIGYEVEKIECDLEYLRNPVGFPTDVANAVPAIILADLVGLNSISFGTVLESAYGIGHENFREYSKGSHWTFFSTLFKGAGIIMALPLAGVSEVGTSIISHRAHIGLVAQSCIRGKWKQSCDNCWKCFRKRLLSMALNFDNIDEDKMSNFFKSGEVRVRLSSYPISHENVMSFSLNRIGNKIENIDYKNLLSRVGGLGRLDLLSKWYSPSIEFVPDEWKYECRENILIYLKQMTKVEVADIRKWSMDEFLLSESTIYAKNNMINRWE